MKKIILFADVGGHGDQEYYHVGDEAMLYESYRWYKNNHSSYQLTVFSWFPTHSDLDCSEVQHLSWPAGKGMQYFCKLILKLFIFKITNRSFFTSSELLVVQTIRTHDRIHFTGGGNLSSYFRPWLYYCFFVLLVAKVFSTKIILTSQTIGPIKGLDRFSSLIFLNIPNLVAIRSKTSRLKQFFRNGICMPQIMSMLDAAYTLPKSVRSKPKKLSKRYVIGLSIHAWTGHEEYVVSLMKKTLDLLAKKISMTVIIIPHHLVSDAEGPDIAYMKKIISSVSNKIKIVIPNSQTILAKKNNAASYIKQLTSDVDLLITSRYHGIVFGCSENVPTIALQYDDYYKIKNNGALQFFYGDRYMNYQVSSSDDNSLDVLVLKTYFLLKRIKVERNILRKINAKIASKQNLLSTILEQCENN